MTTELATALDDTLLRDENRPLRGELLGRDHLDDLARTVASHWPGTARPRARPLLRRIRDTEKVLRQARDEAAADAASREPLTTDAEWLLDNFYVLEEVFREVRADLPAGYYRELPVVAGGAWAGLPRIYALAVSLITHTDSRLDDSLILRFVMAYQDVAPLTIGELWAVPTMLRLALLENLRRLAGQMLAARSDRERAAAWVRRAAGSPVPPPLPDRPSDAFLVAWHAALRDQSPDDPLPPPPPSWSSGNLAEALRREHRRQAANQVSVGNCVTSLRLFNAIDWNVFFEHASVVEQVLRGEPTGVYKRQDFPTRDRYRQAVEQLARSSERDEIEVARLAVDRAAAGTDPRASHVGYHLVAEGREPFARELGCCPSLRDRWLAFLTGRPQTVYFGALLTLTFIWVAVAAVLFCAGTIGTTLLVILVALLPASELAVGITNHVICRLLPPRVPPRFDFATGIPAECTTFVIIPGMLLRPGSGPRLCERLELHYLANPDPSLRFALLTDWSDAPGETAEEDDALLAEAVEGVRALNERYAAGGVDRFFLFHRKRQYNPSEGCWMGWERKRGKIDEFNRLLRGAEDTSFVVRTGDAASVRARFVLTLDADTVLPRDAAGRLIATLAHPLNSPVLSEDGRRVVAGYGVLQPRVNFLLQTGRRSLLARVFAASAGIDPYSSATSDVYQDLFGSGSFTGKGLYDVDAFAATAGRAFPDNHILSHDLIESNFARCGLVTDVEVFDDFPDRYHALAKREHRWIRGDWQLLPWLGRRVPTPEGRRPNVLPALARWKVLDNLRRSLVPPALLVMLVLGWTVLPGPAWGWSLAVLTVLAMPLIFQIFGGIVAILRGTGIRGILRRTNADVAATAGQTALSAIFLANQAILAVDAVVRSLYRIFISRRRRLERETAASIEARLGTNPEHYFAFMWPSLLVTAATVIVVEWVNPSALTAALPWLTVWLVSPAVAYLVSRPRRAREKALSPAVRAELRRTARKTWRFFETFVTAEDRWLPPDNYQEHPKGAIAHRTSPTNMGLLLLSTLSAHDLGYLSLPALIDRLRRSFDTFDQLERYHGHFLNWYETTTLQPLPPAYVSTVDSGNLLGCLLALKNGLIEKRDEPIPAPAAADGLLDALNLAVESLPAGAGEKLHGHLLTAPADLLGWDEWLARGEELAAALPDVAGDGQAWVLAVRSQVRTLREELAAVCPWLPALRSALDRTNDRWQSTCRKLNAAAGAAQWAALLPGIREELAGWAKGMPTVGREAAAESLIAALEQSTAATLGDELDELARRAGGYADAMDFGFLYNPARHLFAIGYNVPIERLDPAHYDLLASEASLASFLAVARGVVPRKHWFQLARPVTRSGGLTGLMSWGGTMFEYLMPRLLLAPLEGTLLEIAQRTAVAAQIEHGEKAGIPWGVSESGFYLLDSGLDYQYQSFGVPGLGLKRGLAKDLVIAPYASLLAVMVDAGAAVANFAELREADGEGPYGFYEALDYTPDRLDRDEKCKVVRSYMAHHQGMGLCALANRLRADLHCRRLRLEPAVRSAELLLQERVPHDAPTFRPEEVVAAEAVVETDRAVNRRITRTDTPAPRTHLLSNGRYTVMVTNSGTGFSICRGLAVSRWRVDPADDRYGTFLYIRDVDTGRVWSAGHQPVCAEADEYEVVFSVDKAEYRRRDGWVGTGLEVTVAPDGDVEVRRLTLVNHDMRPRTLEVTSYVEVVLNDPRADLAHPAFGKLFLETEWLPRWHALACRRRPRSPEQPPVWAVHVVAPDPAHPGPTEYETDRARFLGRRRTPADPEALTRPLTGTVGPVLDPVFALRRTVHLAPGTSATLTFATAVADSREAAVALADQYDSPDAGDRAFDLAWAEGRVELRDLGVTAAESHTSQRLAGHVIYPPSGLRAAVAAGTMQAQQALWRHGISGDLPIVVVCIANGGAIGLARQALKTHAFWRERGFPVDLVLLADQAMSYREELYDDLSALARSSDSRALIDQPGGVFVRRAGQLGGDRPLILAAARVVLDGERGSLIGQTDALEPGRPLPPRLFPPRPAPPPAARRPDVGNLLFANGTGGFTADGREYVITGTPPTPWTNVIASPQAGCLATDSGLAFTWVGNSQSNRLTPWSNDPVGDPPGEAVYLRDEQTGAYWSPTPLPAGGNAPTAVRHGAGYTSYTQDRDGLVTELTTFVAVEDPVKLLVLRVTNRGSRPRLLSAAFYAEWVLGTVRDQTAPFIVTDVDHESGALFAHNSFNADSGPAVAFADTSLRPRTVTGDRLEFLGRNRSSATPAALERVGLSGRAGTGFDPCAGLHGRFEVLPSREAVVVFVLGQAPDPATAARLAMRYRQPAIAGAALKEVIAAWDRRLGTVVVRTPDPRLDVLVNRWLPYQVLSCRLWGRSGFYQSGGAYGFRDQLQDVLALVYAEPAEARAHLLRAAARQFPEGDVQHWWHPQSGRGVRTRFSDDFLWLPYAAARFVAVTGDGGVLDAEVEYLRGPALTEGQHESYFQPETGGETDALYRHCVRALDYGWQLGPHGLPLMGCGDWNDGMNLVGAGGCGESVWVGWFQIVVRSEFAKVAEARGDIELASRLRDQAGQLRRAVEEHAWDGEWYLRAWFDDGTPLGSNSGEECRIDSLSQSWAVFAGSDQERARRAVDEAVRQLVQPGEKLVKLFSPPFDCGSLQPGYIKGYPPGIRENGGQYTHAAIWLLQALAELGRGTEAFALWQLLNPIEHANSPQDVTLYRVEPYVIAADVYGAPPHVGRGGWTWYTGSAAWMYRAALESLLGFSKLGDHLGFEPRVPTSWPGYEVTYRHGKAIYACRVENPSGDGRRVTEVWIDETLAPDRFVRLIDDGQEHRVRFVLGRDS